MRRKIVLILVLLVLGISACGDKTKETTVTETEQGESTEKLTEELTEESTEEPVEEVKGEKKFVLVSEEMTRHVVTSNYSNSMYEFFKYNEYGDPIEGEIQIFYVKDDETTTTLQEYKYGYEWDEYGFITRRLVHHTANEYGGTSDETYINTYDEEGNLIKVVSEGKFSTVTYEFENGLIIKKLDTSKFGEEEILCEYDNGKLVKKTFIVDGVVDEVLTYGEYGEYLLHTYFDDSGVEKELPRPEYEYEYYEDGSLKQIKQSYEGAETNLYFFDENQNLVREECYLSDGELLLEHTYVYEERHVDKKVWDGRLEYHYDWSH